MQALKSPGHLAAFRLAAVTLVAALAACGGAETPARDTTPASAEGGESGGTHESHGNGGHAHDFPPAVDAYHDVLAPLWHAEPGADRAEATCEAAPELDERARAIAEEPAPAAAEDADSWGEASDGLIAATDALAETCAGDGDPEAALAELHDAFHALVAHVGHDH